eukprot:bmy_09208T0
MDRASVSGSGNLNVSVGKRKGTIGGKTEDVNEGLEFHRSCVVLTKVKCPLRMFAIFFGDGMFRILDP